ncbi:MAG: elongation factor G [Oscillospiraceae bacterium]|nr:elongation factor G [Oscillospiraceae bacterium]
MAYTTEKIRNIMFAGHSSAGKTSLTEALLYLTKSSDRLGSVGDGNTVSDFDPEEIKRRASISASVTPYDHEGVRVNIIDTPGLFDFELGMYEGVMAVETVISVLSARSGVEVGTFKGNKVAVSNNKARMFYVSKMAAENADFEKCIAELRSEFGSSVCPLVVPIIEEGKPNIYIDILKEKAYSYSAGKATEVDMPEGILDGYQHDLSEAVAETDEELLDKFIMEEPFTRDELIKGIKLGMKTGSVTPVLCGDAVELEAIDILLEVINNMLPSPCEIDDLVLKNKQNEDVSVKCDAAEKLVAYVFKTVADPFVGKLSYVKVLSGTLTGSSALYNSRSLEQERLGKLLSIKGKRQTDITELIAGDIGAITKLTGAKTGDILCDPSKVLIAEEQKFPYPSLKMAISPKKKGDESKISSSMQRLMEEDRTINYYMSSETGQQILCGLGEQHLDVIISKLKTKFGLEVDLTMPRVAYRETIRKKVRVQGRHKKQSGGHGQFGDVWIEFEPCDSDELVFEEKIFGGSVPRNFFPAVEKGLIESTARGVIAGYPVIGVKATLVDGSYHSVDSSEMAFKTAAGIAFREGMSQASPVLLEPIMSVQTFVPDNNTGDIMGEVTKRRGRILGMSKAEDNLQLVEAEVPESEMSDFTTYIRSSTQGRGSFIMEFLRYEQLPAALEQKVIQETKEFRENEE